MAAVVLLSIKRSRIVSDAGQVALHVAGHQRASTISEVWRMASLTTPACLTAALGRIAQGYFVEPAANAAGFRAGQALPALRSRMTSRPLTGRAISSTLTPLPSSCGQAAPSLVQNALSPSPVTTNASWVGFFVLVGDLVVIAFSRWVMPQAADRSGDQNVSYAGRCWQGVRASVICERLLA